MKKKNKIIKWNKEKKVVMKEYWNSEYDILSFYWGNKTKHSIELDVQVVVDFDKEDNVVGIEIFDFFEAYKKSRDKLDKIFNKKKNKGEKE